ncbi:hypothetical protein BN6_56040 [Saccharothrix espanaensis DSM 44229]|uniref:Uncharacterized protein n=1 Tax=Saccharothrix espanaensis (strain ATCC 51144 / DSM 44229 / JCM 9112 / NBRC 15066 / NRRL 15764) TaxID=1179773 RepID=K0K862_SACES|nr:hypothetical protein BN6_56040 [Saccharothrix espanaensis DSM 44229]
MTGSLYHVYRPSLPLRYCAWRLAVRCRGRSGGVDGRGLRGECSECFDLTGRSSRVDGHRNPRLCRSRESCVSHDRLAIAPDGTWLADLTVPVVAVSLEGITADRAAL